MNIHNFYLDLLLSIRHFFDNIVLTPGVIKSYQFNTGNRTFQLKYETQHELPAAIINFNDARPIKYSSWVNQRMAIDNYYKVPILFNRTKNLTLEVQEEMYEIDIEVNINCDSPLPALNIRHFLESEMPVGKPYKVYNYYTFLEIPETLLTPDKFDVNNDDIVNLHIKHNYVSDKVEYCCSLLCEPLIRLDSSSVPLSNTEPRSFPVNFQFAFLMPIPMNIQIPFSEYPRNTEVREIYETNIVLPTQADIPLVKYFTPNKVTTFPVLKDDKGFYIDSLAVAVNISEYKIKAIGKVTVNNNEYDCDLEFIRDSNNSLLRCIISGVISGEIINCKFINNLMTGTIYIDNTRTFITCEYTIVSQYTKMHDINGTQFPNIKEVPYVTKLDNLEELNIKIVKYNSVKSKITNIYLMENDNTFHDISCDISLDKYGNFRVPVTYFCEKQNRNINSIVIGKIHPDRMRLDIRLHDEQTETEHKLLGICGDFCFDSSPIFGARYIDKVVLDIIPNDNNLPIIVSDSTRFFSDEFNRLSTDSSLKLLRSILLVPREDNTVFTKNTDSIIITIDLNNIIDLTKISKDFYWKFTFRDDTFDSRGHLITLQNNVDNILSFDCDWDLFHEYLINYSVNDPIFFQIFEVI